MMYNGKLGVADGHIPGPGKYPPCKRMLDKYKITNVGKIDDIRSATMTIQWPEFTLEFIMLMSFLLLGSRKLHGLNAV